MSKTSKSGSKTGARNKRRAAAKTAKAKSKPKARMAAKGKAKGKLKRKVQPAQARRSKRFGSSSPAPRPVRSPVEVIAGLTRKAQALGTVTGVVMPIDEIKLGVKLSEQPRAEAISALLELAEHANMHARRVALSALRRMNAADDPRVLELYLRGLSDPEGWVRYDAAWALGDSGTRDPRALSGLEALAKDAPTEPELSDADQRAAARAAESLAALRTIS